MDAKVRLVEDHPRTFRISERGMQIFILDRKANNYD